VSEIFHFPLFFIVPVMNFFRQCQRRGVTLAAVVTAGFSFLGDSATWNPAEPQ